MDREQLEHVIRAAGDVLGEKEVIVFGSQAILGAFPDGLPRTVLMSREADVSPLDGDKDKVLLINGAIGELTSFDVNHGYYAEGVEIEGLAVLPEGWRDRLVPVSSPATNGVTGPCLEPHDLCVSKLLAGRDGDFDFVRALVRSGHVKRGVLLERLEMTDLSPERRESAVRRLVAIERPGRHSRFKRALRDLAGGTPASSIGVEASGAESPPDAAALPHVPPSSGGSETGHAR